MNTKNPGNVPATEPTVTVVWSESSHLYDGQTMPLSRANAAFLALDEQRRAERVKPGYSGSWYDKTSFKLDFVFHGEADTYEGRQDFGDGDGSLIDHIEAYHRYYENAPQWKAHVLSTGGEEAWEQDVAERRMILDELIPYLRMHCNLTEMESEAREAQRYVLEHSANELEYFDALLVWVKQCRGMLNRGEYSLPPAPQLVTYDESFEAYKAQVLEEIRAEAEAVNMTVAEYAANGYEAKGGTE